MEALLKFLEQLFRKDLRPLTSITKVQNTYTQVEKELIYSDADAEYKLNERFRATTPSTTVHSRESFVSFIKEELRRRNNEDGNYATVQVGINESKFCADDDKNEGFCTFERIYSEQFEALSGAKNKLFDHNSFLLLLQRLKPSIIDFKNVYTKLSTIRIAKTAKMQSQPIFNEDGEMEEGVTCQFMIQSAAREGTTEEITLPTNFKCTMPYVKAGTDNYTFDIELQITKDDYDRPAILLQIPNYEIEIEHAIKDEIKYISDNLQDKKNLLILKDI